MSPEFNDILLYTDAIGKVKIEVIYEDDNFWLSPKKMTESSMSCNFLRTDNIKGSLNG